jgi:hypothetical protein
LASKNPKKNKVIDLNIKKITIPTHKNIIKLSLSKRFIIIFWMLSLKSNLFINMFLSIKIEKKAGKIPMPIVSKIPIKIEKIK